MTLKERAARRGGGISPERVRADLIAELVGQKNWAYAPQFYVPDYHADGTLARHEPHPERRPRAKFIGLHHPQDFDAFPLPTRPVVPYVQTPHDRIALEIMRGCPWQCRFCQSTVIKRPLRVRSVESIVTAALESYKNTGHNEISLLSLSTSDYPYFEGTRSRACTQSLRLSASAFRCRSLRVDASIAVVCRS